MKKPDSCKDCPLYPEKKFFFPSSVMKPTLSVISDYPTVNQCLAQSPTDGDSGSYLLNNLVPLTGVDSTEVQFDYLLKCHLPKNYVRQKGGKANLSKAVDICRPNLLEVGPGTALVCHGNLAAQFIGNVKSAESFRGFQGKEFAGNTTYITMATDQVMRQPRMTIPAMLDWKKLGTLLKGEWPKKLPWVERCYGDTFAQDIEEFCSIEFEHIVIDTEYDTKKDTLYPGNLELIGILGYKTSGVILGIQIPWSKQAKESVDFIKENLLKLTQHYPTVFHNATADIPVLEKACGIKYTEYCQVEDTMLMHGVLHCEQPHDLGFLESVYSPYDKMKHLMKEDPFLYNWGDCLSTHHAYMGMMEEFENEY